MNEIVIFIGWLCLIVFAVVVQHYMQNMDRKFRASFWVDNVIFLAVRNLNVTLLFFSFIDTRVFLIASTITTIVITTYLSRYIHNIHGKVALKKKSDLDLLGAKASFFEETNLTVYIKEYINGEFVTVYVNPAFNEKIHKPNGQPDYDCIGKDNSYWGDFKEEYDRQDYEAFVNNNPITVVTGYTLNGEIATGTSYKHKGGKYLYGYALL